MENAVDTQVSGDSAEGYIPDAELPEEEVLETSEEDEETEEGDEDKPKKKGGFQRKIEKLEAEKQEMERRLQELASRQHEAQFRMQQQQMAAQMQGQKPTLEQFNYDAEAFENAYTQWVSNTQRAQAEAQQRAYMERMHMQKAMHEQVELQGKIKTAAQAYPDWEEVVMNPSVPPLRQVNPAAFEMVKESDQMADIGYYLAKNPQEIMRFQGMNPLQVAREVAKLEAKFVGASGSAALKPTAQVKGRSSAGKDPDSMPMDEWVKWRNKQLSRN